MVRLLLHLFQSRPPALVRGRDAHRFAILGDRATRHRNALHREQFRDAPVAQGGVRVLFLDELADLGADGGGGGAGAVGAFDLAREEVAQLEDPARCVHVLAGGDARNRRLVHRDRFGDVLEDHRPHVLLALLEERRLALDDGAGDFHEGFVADLQALEQPARLLQLRAHARVAGVAPDEAGVALIEPHACSVAGLISTPQPCSVRRTNTSGTTYCALPALTVAPGRGWQERTSASAASSSSSVARSSRRSSVSSRPATSSRCWRAICSAVAKPGVAGSSCRSCNSMHSATDRAPTPGGSRACNRASTPCTSSPEHSSSGRSVCAISASDSVR